MPAVELNGRRQTHGEAGGQLSRLPLVGQQAGKVAGPPLGYGVQADAQQGVVHKGVVEPVLHRFGKLLQVSPLQLQGGDDLPVEHLLQKAPHHRVGHAVPDDIKARQVGPRHKAGVPTVEYPHLPVLVGGHIGHHRAVESRSPERQFVRQPLRPLDDPDAEHLPHIQQGVSVTQLRLQFILLRPVPDTAGYDAIHQGGAEGTPLEPLHKGLLQPPLGGVALHTVLQNRSVVVDQLTGQDHQARLPGLPTAVQHLGQFGGEGGGRLILQLAGGVVDDARLGGVGHDILQFRGDSHLQHGLIILPFVGVEAAAHR